VSQCLPRLATGSSNTYRGWTKGSGVHGSRVPVVAILPSMLGSPRSPTAIRTSLYTQCRPFILSRRPMRCFMSTRARSRAERRARTESAVRRQLKILSARGRIQHRSRSQPHRFAKRHAILSGKPWRPYFCNPRRRKRVKGKDRLTVQERRANERCPLARSAE
jgi:hypothetical protein